MKKENEHRDGGRETSKESIAIAEVRSDGGPYDPAIPLWEIYLKELEVEEILAYPCS